MTAAIKERVLVALRDAGARGLTRDELANRFGSTYGLRLRELAQDGHSFRFERGRGRAWWRIVLLAEAAPSADSAEHVALELPLDAPTTAPTCAIFDTERGTR